MKYRREIDGLRAIAVLPVLFFHADFSFFSGGFVGVDVFFVISGYLITSIIIQQKKNETFSLIVFYERRARRILPALFLVIAACIPFAWLWMLPSEFRDFSESVVATVFFVSNFHFLSESGYFSQFVELKPLLHMWSLAVEEQYYLFFPIWIIITWSLGKRLNLMLFALIFVCSLLLAHYGALHKPHANFYLLPSRGWELLLGVFAAYFLSNMREKEYLQNKLVNEISGLIGLLSIFYAVIYFDKEIPFPSFWTLIPTIGTLLVIVFANPTTLVGRFLGHRAFVGIGLISYSLYLWHQPLFAFARLRFPNYVSPTLYILLMLISCILAFLTWQFVEGYFRNRKNVKQKYIFVSSASTIIVFASLSFVAINANGFPERYKFSNSQLIKTTDEFAEYVQSRHKPLLLKNFDHENTKAKLLLVGDSFAKDMINAVYEANLTEKYQLSFHHIESSCGNLLLPDYSTIESFVHKDCLKEGSYLIKDGRYTSEALLKLVKDADEIWLVSAWPEWSIRYLPVSLNNLKNITKANIYIFSLKQFGEINFRSLINTPVSKRPTKARLANQTISINARMKAILPAENYIDLTEFYCDPLNNNCLFLKDDGFLLSYDGSHLTREGAQFFGSKLKDELLKRRSTSPSGFSGD